MALNIVVEDSFKKSWKKLEKKKYDYKKMGAVIKLLEHEERLPGKYKDHALKGDMQGFRECHIEKNWLLVYRIDGDNLVLLITGSHDDIFK